MLKPFHQFLNFADEKQTESKGQEETYNNTLILYPYGSSVTGQFSTLTTPTRHGI